MAATSTNPAGAVEAARSFFDADNAHDVGRMVAACSQDARLRYLPMGDHGDGKAVEVGQSIWSGLIDAFPDLKVTVQSVFGDDRNAAAEVVIGGTQHKHFFQITNRGKHYELPHAFLLRLDDRGRITDIAAYWDNASFYSQLGKTTLE
jgi:steroid delta-isomerase-like uncharacterized protein